ncbi:hypothetical protein AB1I63_02360 [Streptococcus pneumoniae]
MTKIDKQLITLYKVEDTSDIRRYSAISGDCIGIATIDKDSLEYSYDGDDLGKFTTFVKDTLTKSIELKKQLPEKIVYGFG